MRKMILTEEETNACITKIQAFYQLGQRLRQTSSNPADACSDGGRRWTPYLLDIARRFSREYTEEELDHLCEQIRRHRPAFGISHIGIMITIPATQRDCLQRDCIEKNWSTNDLKAAKLKWHRKKSGGGRRPQVTADNAVAQFLRHSDRLRRLCARVGTPCGTTPVILKELSPTMQQAIKAARKAMISLGNAAQAELRKTQCEE